MARWSTSGERSITRVRFSKASPKTRDKDAALRFMKKTLKRHGSPEAITTDGLRYYGAAMNELGNAESRRSVAGPTTGWKTATCPFDDGSGRCSRFRRMKTLQKFAMRTCQRAQPLQPRSPPHRSTNLQGTPLGRTGRVANPRELGPGLHSPSPIVERRVRFRLTAPPPSHRFGEVRHATDGHVGSSIVTAPDTGVIYQRRQ